MHATETPTDRRRIALPALLIAATLALPAGGAGAQTESQSDAAAGLQLAASGRCREALEPLRHALDADAGNCAVRAELGSCLLSLGKEERADRVLSEAVSCTETAPIEAGALAAWRHRRLEIAGSLFERITELDPGRAEIWGYLARVRFSQERLEATADAARHALDGQPDDVQMRGLLALALTRTGREAEAVPELERYLEAVPEDAGARVLLALLHVRLGERREAVEQLRLLVAEAPDTPRAATLLGAGLYDLGDLDEAREVLEQALDSDPESRGLAALALGRIYAHEGRWESAAELLATAEKELGSDFPDADLLEHVREEAARG
ncbi:MAG: tetratricopeptide repeat protein [Thermoanaerobaculia bacterium]